MTRSTVSTVLSAAAEKHLGSYALAAAAGAGALTAAQVGHAAVLSFTYNNEVLQPQRQLNRLVLPFYRRPDSRSYAFSL